MAEASEVKSDDTTGDIREGASDHKVAAMGDEENAKDPRQDQQEDDLEDGEIESDEDEPIVTFVQPPPPPAAVEPPKSKKFKSDPSPGYTDLPEKSTKSYPPVKTSRKFSRGGVMEGKIYDWAENIENAIAAALKKDGIEPSRPEFKKHDDVPDEPPPSKNKSRKRKKRDQDKEKSKKKKHVHEEQAQIESDIDENEMLCIRGASPPLLLSSGRIGAIPPEDLPQAPNYYESDGSYTSYETEDSIEYRKPYEEKRQNRRNKDRRHRKGGGRGGGGTAADKRRNREESDGVCIDYLRGACANDDCPRNHDGRAQRKLELCKFYLMECCAKKEKCLYMHADFPCKYYYLGMECVYKGNCKFSHGKPLTDQLRNILLKHIETAPKEILGNFRRISRENAVTLLNTAHAKICDDHGIENTLATTSTTSTMTATTAATSSTSSTPSLSKQSNSASEPSSSIPSLLDMVIKPPAISPRKEDKEKLSKGEKTRKSRWCDSQQGSTSSSMSTPPSQQQQAAGSGGGTGVSIPASFLNLKNLTGVITSDQIEKLESLGIENLEQVNQLTVAQLNNIGLTISQINEIQLNALNIQKLGLIGANSGTSAGQAQFSPSETKSLSAANQDIDMRFLVAPPKIPSPGLYPASGGGGTASSSTPAVSSSGDTDKMQSANVRFTDADIASPEPTPNYGSAKCFPLSDPRSDDLRPAESTTNSSVVDYSQYLKDAHIDADKIDLNNIALDKDDETLIEDEPELLIDESWCPSEDEHGKDSKNDDGEDNWDDDDDKAKPSTTKAENGKSDWESSDQGKQEEPEEDWSVCAPAADYQQPSQDFCDENWDDDMDRPTAPAPKSDEYQEQSKRDNWDRRNYGKFRQNQNEEDNWGSSDYSKPPTKAGGTGGSGFYSQQQDTQSNYGGYGRMYQSGPSYFQQHQQQQQQLHQPYHPNQQQCQPYEQQPADDEENWDDDLDQQHQQQQQQTQPQKSDPRCDSYLSHAPMPAIYDPKSLIPSAVTSKIDISASVSSLMGMLPTPQSSTNQTYIDACGLIQDRVENEAKSSPQSDPREFRGDPRLYKSVQQQQQHHQHTSEDTFSVGIRSPPVQHRTSLDLPKYDRISIYDGTPKTPEDDQAAGRKSDKDMRLSGFLDPNKSDIDLRLPFKRVMTNYIPATEIDGSISSHPPISYKVVEIEIPKPDYSEIRRSVPVTDKTLDPRLRRIFCLKESIDGDNESTASFLSSLGRQADTEKSVLVAVLGGPRVDPRRKKENQDMFGGGGASSTAVQQSAGGVQHTPPPPSKTLDIRMLLQKSDWYKNLNSKVKIMVNQQLALVSTELKKFHQDPSPNKLFDIQFIVSNQYLQQILTNLGIYIDDYGEVRQLENETDDGVVGGGGGGPSMAGMMGMRMGMMDGGLGGGAGGMPMAQGAPPMMPMDFLRGPPPMNAAAAAAAMQQRFMGGMMPFGGPPKPGLLGIAPGVGYNPFDPSNPNCGVGSPGDGGFPTPGQGGYDGGDGNMFGGGGGNNFPGASGSGFYRSGSRGKNDGGGGGSGGGGSRGNRNFRGGSGGSNSRNNDRWGGNSGPRNDSGGGGNRRNYENSRGGGRGGGGGRDRSDSRRDKM